METPEIIATAKGGTSLPLIEPGTYPARCYSMIFIGTVPTNFQGTESLKEKIRITWELPTERMVFKEGEEEKPRVISKEYTLSLHENATLRQHLKAWRGKDFTTEEANRFNVAKLVGKTCTLTVGHNTGKDGNTYVEITGIGPYMKGMPEYKQVNESFILTYQNWDWDAFNTLPKFLKDKMETSKEYKAMTMHIMEDEQKRSQLESGMPLEKSHDDLPF